MSDREALAAALDVMPGLRIKPDLAVLATAARERLAQLPEKCGGCDGTGIAGTFSHIHQETGTHLGDEDIPCPSCHGSGKVYPAELVKRLAIAISTSGVDTEVTRGMAVAVLDALNGVTDAS